MLFADVGDALRRAQTVVDYIVRLVRATRESADLAAGATCPTALACAPFTRNGESKGSSVTPSTTRRALSSRYTARSTTLRSSRTLPGQVWASSCVSAAGEKPAKYSRPSSCAMRSPKRCASILANILKRHPDIGLVINTGDSIYAADYNNITRERVLEQWKIWDEVVMAALKRLPIIHAIGNHDPFDRTTVLSKGSRATMAALGHAAAQVPHVLAAVNNAFLQGFSEADWEQLRGLVDRMAANGAALLAARSVP